MGYIGKCLRRREDPRLLKGNGYYADDYEPPGTLHLAILRSPVAHAIIKDIDVSVALAVDGVKLAFSGQDLPSDLQPIPLRLTGFESTTKCLQYPLAQDRIRYCGEPLAVVVASSRYEAEDALEKIEVKYEVLPPVTSIEEGLKPDAPVLHQALGHNKGVEFAEERGDVEEAFGAADLIVEREFSIQRHASVPMEPRSLVADYDRQSERLTLFGAAKVIHFNRNVLASLLGIAESQIRLVELDVGGGFGARGEFYPEDYLVPYAAMKVGAPVKWTEDRRENLLALNHSREQKHKVAIAVKKDGTILGMRDKVYIDHGAYMRTHGVTVTEITVGSLVGPYKVPTFKFEATDVMTNKTPTGTYRAPGEFEATFVREVLFDIVAKALGMCPAEFRRKNLVLPADLPYHSGAPVHEQPMILDSGDYPSVFEKALTAIHYEELSKRKKAMADQRYRIGVGLACYVSTTGTPPWEYARLEVDMSGRVTAYLGSSSLGQGSTTGLLQILADELNITPDSIRIVEGDTDRVPYGVGSWGDRTIIAAGGAIVGAASKLRKKMFELTAHILEVAIEDLELREGRVQVQGVPRQGLSFGELARYSLPARSPKGHPLDFEPGMVVSHFYDDMEKMTNAFGVQACVVEVDLDTGKVRLLDYVIAFDVGRAVNPLLVKGQLQGGLAQGIGGALLEEFVYDDNGQLLSGSFVDYLLPTAGEVPNARILLCEEPQHGNVFGVRGAGNAGTIPVGAVVANAVADALSDLSLEVNALPLSPSKVYQLIQSGAV